MLIFTELLQNCLEIGIRLSLKVGQMKARKGQIMWIHKLFSSGMEPQYEMILIISSVVKKKKKKPTNTKYKYTSCVNN